MWIESHTVLMRHRKLREFAREIRVRPSHAMGHLHALWHAALEQREDGDLSSWSDEFIAEMSDFPGDAPQYVRLLQKHHWLDGKKLHDWLDYAGLYLIKKYSTSDRERLVAIWAVHGREYGANGKRTVSERKVSLPNPPNPPNPPGRGAREPEASNIPSESEAIAMTVSAGIPGDFATFVYHDWRSRNGRDACGSVVSWLPYVTKRWTREQVEWKAGTHRGNKKRENSKPGGPDRNAGTYNAHTDTTGIKSKVR